MQQVLLLLLVILSSVPAQASASIQKLTLLDQYDQPHSPSQEGRTIVLLASDRKGEAETVQWRMKLVERYQSGLMFLGVADARGVPFFLKRAVRNTFRKYPAPVLLDWEGELFSTLELTPGVPNLVLIEKTGFTRVLHSGEATDAACAMVFEEIDRLFAGQ